MVTNEVYNITSSDPESHHMKNIPEESANGTGIYDHIDDSK